MRMFERFYRVAMDRSGASGGAGLGLSIAREIARVHGGEIGVESRGSSPSADLSDGGWTVFTVTLPLEPSAGRHG